MPTKVIGFDGSIANWPTDYIDIIRNTVTGKDGERFSLEGSKNISTLAQNSQISNLIEFDNDSFVEEGLEILKGIENEKILTLAKEGNPSAVLYRDLERSRIFDDVKDFTLKDMEDSDNLLKIIGYSLFGKVTDKEPEEEIGLYEEYADTPAAQRYVESFRNIPQTEAEGRDAPNLPAMFMTNKYEPIETFTLRRRKIDTLDEHYEVEIKRASSSDKVSEFFYFNYDNTSQRRNFLERFYPNLVYKTTGKDILDSTRAVSPNVLSGDITINLDFYEKLIKNGKYVKATEAQEILGDFLQDEFYKKFFFKFKKFLEESNKADPLRDEKYKVYFSGTLRKIPVKDATPKTFKVKVKIQSVEKGRFDISPFAKNIRRKGKKPNIDVILQQEIKNRLVAPKDVYMQAVEEYIDKENELSNLSDEDTKQLEGQNIEVGKLQEIIRESKESATKRMQEFEEYSQRREYRFNERLADHIEEIMDRFSVVENAIKEGA